METNKTLSQRIATAQLFPREIIKYLGKDDAAPKDEKLKGYVDFYKEIRSGILGIKGGGGDAGMKKFGEFINSFFVKLYDMEAEVSKSFAPGISAPMVPTTQTFFADHNELQVDELWKQFFSMEFPGTNGGSVQLVDVTDLETEVSEIADGEPGQLSAWGKTSHTELRRRRFWFGRACLRLWFENNEIWNINRTMRSFMLKFAKKHADLAYAALVAAPAATTTATAATLDGWVKMMDDGFVTLGERLSGKGFSFNPGQPVIVLGRANHSGTINATLNRQSGSETNNTKVTWPIRWVPTFNTNVPVDVGGKDSVFLIMPGLKNEWVQFDALRSAQDYDFDTDAVKIRMQEYLNLSVNGNQVQRLQIEP